MMKKIKSHTINNCKIYLANSEQFLSTLENESIDAIITDPPYQYLDHKLDKPFDEKKIFENWQRVLKPDRLISFFGFGEAFHKWNVDLKGLGFKHKETLVWEKTQASNPFNNVARTVEFISMLAKRKASVNKCYVDFFEHSLTNNNIDTLEKNYKALLGSLNNFKSMNEIKKYLEKGIIEYKEVKRGRHGITVSGNFVAESKSISIARMFKQGRRESSILRCRRDIDYKHPTQKPIDLMTRIINLTTKENDTVLDPFCGGGSTGVACVKTNRHFVGIEKMGTLQKLLSMLKKRTKTT